MCTTCETAITKTRALADTINKIRNQKHCGLGGPWHAEIEDLNVEHDLMPWETLKESSLWNSDYDEIDPQLGRTLIAGWNAATETERIAAAHPNILRARMHRPTSDEYHTARIR